MVRPTCGGEGEKGLVFKSVQNKSRKKKPLACGKGLKVYI
jgi:hypothetical protein